MATASRVHEDELGWDGSIRTFQGSPFTGVSIRLHPNGALMFELPYIDGRADGRMREWDSIGRLIREQILGESLAAKVDKDDSDHGWLVQLANDTLANLSPKQLDAIIKNIPPSGTETTEYRYDADGELILQLITQQP